VLTALNRFFANNYPSRGLEAIVYWLSTKVGDTAAALLTNSASFAVLTAATATAAADLVLGTVGSCQYGFVLPGYLRFS
jgi:hypothetical protein